MTESEREGICENLNIFVQDTKTVVLRYEVFAYSCSLVYLCSMLYSKSLRFS